MFYVLGFLFIKKLKYKYSSYLLRRTSKEFFNYVLYVLMTQDFKYKTTDHCDQEGNSPPYEKLDHRPNRLTDPNQGY